MYSCASQVVIDRETGRSKGYGFVKFDDPRDADDAINGSHGKVRWPSQLSKPCVLRSKSGAVMLECCAEQARRCARSCWTGGRFDATWRATTRDPAMARAAAAAAAAEGAASAAVATNAAVAAAVATTAASTDRPAVLTGAVGLAAPLSVVVVMVASAAGGAVQAGATSTV